MATVGSFRLHERLGPAVGVPYWVSALVWWLVYAIVFINAADFRGDTGEEFQIHWQIYLRLLVCGICGTAGILLAGRSYAALLTFPGFLMTLLIAWIGITLPFSIDRSYSIAAYVSLGAVVMLIPAAMQILGGYRYLSAVAAGLLSFVVGSWFVYWMYPEIGIFQEQVSQSDVVQRMGGLGHPNELGQYSAFATVLFAALGYGRRISWLVAGPAMLLGFATLAACFSRTSMAITLIGLLVLYRKELFTERTLLWLMLIAITAISAVFVIVGTGEADWTVDDALKRVSKSGSSDELTTATGRTEIWSHALERIAQQPLYGFGYVTARFVMNEHSYHCHNIVLNMSLYSGIFGGMILLSMMLYFIYAMYYDPRFEIDGLIAIILAGGLIDGMLFAAVPSAAILIWVSALLWRQLEMRLNPPDDPVNA